MYARLWKGSYIGRIKSVSKFSSFYSCPLNCPMGKNGLKKSCFCDIKNAYNILKNWFINRIFHSNYRNKNKVVDTLLAYNYISICICKKVLDKFYIKIFFKLFLIILFFLIAFCFSKFLTICYFSPFYIHVTQKIDK